MQRVNSREGLLVETFAKDTGEHWLVVNPNIVEGTDLPGWLTDEFYFLPFQCEPGNKDDLRTLMTQGYDMNLTCRLLARNAF